MEPFHLRLKIGEHEFDAEGEQEAVERQFAVWRQLITELPSPPPVPAAPSGATPPAGDFSDYDKILKLDERVVSLTVLPQGEHAAADAALLIILGRKQFLNEDLVGGAAILKGLERSGMAGVRLDRVFGDYMDQLVIRVGQNRAVRYRLTNPGLTRTKEIAKELADRVA